MKPVAAFEANNLMWQVGWERCNGRTSEITSDVCFHFLKDICICSCSCVFLDFHCDCETVPCSI